MWSSIVMSLRATRIFQFSAWWTLLASAAIVMLRFYPSIVDSHSIFGTLISILIGIIGMIGSITSLLLLAGMITHLVTCSGFSKYSKILWLALIILLLPLGEIIYFFAVYRRDERLNNVSMAA